MEGNVADLRACFVRSLMAKTVLYASLALMSIVAARSNAEQPRATL
jgi:hypothetical protein